jgi:hypothetical protein
VKEEIRADQEYLKEETLTKLHSHHEGMMARTDSQPEKMEATDFEANSDEIESESEHEEVPKEEAAVESTGALEDRYGDRNLAAGRHRQPKKRTQGGGGLRKKLATVRRRMTRRAVPARRKGRIHKEPWVEMRKQKNQMRDDFVRGTPKGPKFKKTNRPQKKCNNVIRKGGSRWQLRLRNERANPQQYQRMKQETGATSGKQGDII